MADSVVGGGDVVETENNHERKENLSNSFNETETHGVQKDADTQKNKEREERFRLARERQKEEQRRKMEEMRDAMTKAEEFRKRQEEERRRKIEEMRKREEEHRATVEERRKKLLDEENERKQAILRRTAEREAKLEQAKSKKMCNTVLHPLGCGKSYQSDGTLSSTGRSPSHHRPHSMAGRLPNYTTDTISSQLRVGRSKEKQSVASCAVVCSRFRSVSPTKNGRAQSIGSARRSRSDVQKISEQLTSSPKPLTEGVAIKHFQNDKPAPAVNSTRRARSVSSRPSKLLASPVSAPVANATLPRGGKTSPSKPVAQTSAKSSKSTTPLGNAAPLTKGGAMPSPPKTITPRSLPKEPKSIKEVTSNKSITSNKVKAVHNQANQDIAADGNKQIPDVLPKAAEAEEPKLVKKMGVVANPSENLSSPEKADVMKKSVTEEDEYKLKLAEKRRLAREKAEREAEEERQRIEKERLEEEERIRVEEEEERRREEEEIRLAEEAARVEAERFQKAVEEEERRRREEDERLEAEKKEKLEAEIRAQEEAEKKEKERIEKAKREEVERLERKKRLESIMKRVNKTEETSPPKPEVTVVPATQPATESGTIEPPPVDVEKVEPVSAEPTIQPSATELTDSVASAPSEIVTAPVVPANPIVSAPDPVDKGTSQFRSPLLRQMLGNKLKAKSDVASEISPKVSVSADVESKEKVPDSEGHSELNLSSSSDAKQEEDSNHKDAKQNLTEEDSNHKDAKQNLTEEDSNHKDAKLNMTEEDSNHKDAKLNMIEEDSNHKDVKQNLTEEDSNHKDAKQNLTEEDSNHRDAKLNMTEEDSNHKDAKLNLTEADSNHKDAKQNLTEEESNHKDAKQNLTEEDSNHKLEMLVPTADVLATETSEKDLTGIESPKNSNDIRIEQEVQVINDEHNNEDVSIDTFSSSELFGKTNDEPSVITDGESKEFEEDKILDGLVGQSGLSSHLNSAAYTIGAMLFDADEDDVDILSIAGSQSADHLVAAKPHEASGFLLSPEEPHVAKILPSGIGASNGNGHGIFGSDAALVDLSFPEVSSGSSLAVDLLNNHETGASSPRHPFSESSVAKENLLDLRDDSGVDQLIDLSISEPAAHSKQSLSQSDFQLNAELTGQTTVSPTSPVGGVPLVAFEDNSNIQLKSINDVVL